MTQCQLVPPMTCVIQPQEVMETREPLGRGGALPLCDNSLHPDILEVGFRTMPASSLVVQGSPGTANGR